MSRVSAHAAQTAVLEAQLAVLESEQEDLRSTLATTKDEERAAQARWRKAERQLGELEQQLERIDREHALEKARTQNILQRMEQRKLASQRSGAHPNPMADKTALSRFMKEILAENGHLQLGVAELRDLLAQSQEEVNTLRQKIEDMDADQQRAANMTSQQQLHHQHQHQHQPLSIELARSPLQAAVLGGVVVHHHHYHAPPPPPRAAAVPAPAVPAPAAAAASATAIGKEKATLRPVIRRPKKKRNVSLDRFDALRVKGPGPGSTNCNNSNNGAFPKRWPSSTGPLSSSPTSTVQESSIFDRLDGGDETSRPTSVDSNCPPLWPKQSWARHQPNRASSNPPPFTILHTTEEVPSEADGSQPDGASPILPPNVPVPVPVPVLKRSVSHESLLSISAMDPTAYLGSPALSASSYVSRAGCSPNPRHASVKPDDPQASITPGIAIRDQPGSIGYGGSAYSRLLGLHRAESYGSSPPADPGKPSSRKPSSTSNSGSGWFWKYVTLAPGGSKPGCAQEPAPRPASKVAGAAWPAVGYVDEDLLRESLVDGPGLS